MLMRTLATITILVSLAAFTEAPRVARGQWDVSNADRAATQASEKLIRKVYPVADLVIPIAGTTGFNLAKGAVPNPAGCDACADKQAEAALPDVLIKLITGAVCPKSWSASGGSATIDYFPNGMGLVVNQTAGVHEQIGELLLSLRKLQDVQIAVEMRVVRLSAAHLKSCPLAAHGKPILVNNERIKRFLDDVQGDRRTNVMQAPKVTMFNGQRAVLQAGETRRFVTAVDVHDVDGRKAFTPRSTAHFLGTRFDLQGVVAPDRQSVAMKVKAELSQLTGTPALFPVTTHVSGASDYGKPIPPTSINQYIQLPIIQKITAENSAAIPLGSTLLTVASKVTTETRSEHTPVILSKIPYINRLFTKVTTNQEEEVVLLLVTPRIVEVKDDGKEIGGNPSELDDRAPVACPRPPELPCPDASMKTFTFKGSFIGGYAKLTVGGPASAPVDCQDKKAQQACPVAAEKTETMPKIGVEIPEHAPFQEFRGGIPAPTPLPPASAEEPQTKPLPQPEGNLGSLPVRDIGPDRPGMCTLPEGKLVSGPVPQPTVVQLKNCNVIAKCIDPNQSLEVIDGRSRIILLKSVPTRIEFADEGIISHSLLEPKELLILGKQAGTTTMTVWFIDPDDKKEKIFSRVVRCIPDPERTCRFRHIYKALEIEIHKYFPDTTIRLDIVGSKVLASGTAQNTAQALQILHIIRGNVPNDMQRLAITTASSCVDLADLRKPAEAPTPESLATAGGPNVINMIRIPSEQQIMLRVTVAEVNRTAAKTIGLEFDKGGVAKEPIFVDGGKTLDQINVLKELNYARVLAQPNLVCLNGQTASFQAGGQLPAKVVVPHCLPEVQLTPMGLQLNFTPTVTDGDRIRLDLHAIVSTRVAALSEETTDGNRVFMSGVKKQKLQTTVALGKGQTAAFSGLSPKVGDRIVVILVTPEIVKPAPIAEPVAAPMWMDLLLKKAEPGAVRAWPAPCAEVGIWFSTKRGPVGAVGACPACPAPGAEAPPAEAPMNLADVAALATSGVSDEVILTQIHTTGASFKLCTEDILFLKKNKVSDRVVMEMQHSRHRLEEIAPPMAVPVGHWLPAPVYLPGSGAYDPTMPNPPASHDAVPTHYYQPVPAPSFQPSGGYPEPYYQPMPAMPMPPPHDGYSQPYYQPVPAMPMLPTHDGYSQPYYQPVPAMPMLPTHDGYSQPYYQPVPAMPMLPTHDGYSQPYYQHVPVLYPHDGYSQPYYQHVPAMPMLSPHDGYSQPNQPAPTMPMLPPHDKYSQPYYQHVPAMPMQPPHDGYSQPYPPPASNGPAPAYAPPAYASPTTLYIPALDGPRPAPAALPAYAPLPGYGNPQAPLPPQPMMPSCPAGPAPCPAPSSPVSSLPPAMGERASEEDPKMPAKFPLKPRPKHENEEVKVVVLTTCAQGMPADAAGIDRALAGVFIKLLQDRCAENKEKVVVTKQAIVDDFKKKNPDWQGLSPVDLGKELKADYIIDIEVLDMTLFEEGTRKEFLRGRSRIAMTVYDSHKTFAPAFSPPDLDFTYPSRHPLSKFDEPLSTFKQKFIKRIAGQLVLPLTAYSSEQKVLVD